MIALRIYLYLITYSSLYDFKLLSFLFEKVYTVKKLFSIKSWSLYNFLVLILMLNIIYISFDIERNIYELTF